MLPEWGPMLAELVLAFGTIIFVWRVKGEEVSGATHDRNLMLLYLVHPDIIDAVVPRLLGGLNRHWRVWRLVPRGRAHRDVHRPLGRDPLPGGWMAGRLDVALGERPQTSADIFTTMQGLLTLVLAYYLQIGG